MKLNYNILWFEDNIEWYKSILPSIEEILDDNGFDLIVEQRVDQSDLEELINADKWDLILVDYNLSDGEKGDDIIEVIRYSLFTDIIFYSQKGAGNIRKEITEKGIDGVFCASRDGDEFLLKVERVINTTIKKVTDINPLRGLVMAETSEIDDLMRELLLVFLDDASLSKNQDKFIDYITSIVEESLKDTQKRITRYKNSNDIHSILLSPIFDMYKKSRAVDKALKFSTNKELNGYSGIGMDYFKKIGKKRNLLAHVKEEIRDNERVLVSHIMNKEPIIFNTELCKNMRMEIISYKNHFDKIKRILQE